MKKFCAAVALALVMTGCAGGAAPANPDAGSIPAPATPTPADGTAAGTSGPGTAPPPAATTPGPQAKLVPVQYADLGISYSYPDTGSPPELIQPAVDTYTLRFPTWSFTVFRKEADPGKDLASLAQEHIEVNTRMSSGRILSTDLGERALGGQPARAIQAYFSSAAGRTDWLHHIVLRDGHQYVISCQTKEGPPPIPWESVSAACEQVLGTVSFDSLPLFEPIVTFVDDQVRLPEGMVGTIPAGASPSGFTLLLDGFDQYTAVIYFEECSPQAPDTGCVGNHRAHSFTRKITVAGRTVTQIEAIFQQPAAANDPRSWVERHTILVLPSGRKVDIISQALSGSEAEPKLREAYQELLDSLRTTN